MSEYLFYNITELKSPVGVFSIKGGGKTVRFSVRKNTFDVPYEVCENEKSVLTLSSENNYILEIDIDALEAGNTYKICFSAGGMKYCASDEHTEALSVTLNGRTVGLGMYDPNDEEKLRQAFAYSKQTGCYRQGKIAAPPSYDESKFCGYLIEPSDDGSGYLFKVLDDATAKICFSAAWIENGNIPAQECESAIGFWLT